MKMLLICMMMVFTTIANGADNGLDPDYLKVKIYKFAVSTSELCTNPQMVFSNANPVYEDLLTSPTFGTGTLANGTYKCVMLEISDNIKFAPIQNSDSGGCIIGQETTLDLCRGGEFSQAIDGQNVNCQVGEDKVVVYLSVGSTNIAGSEQLSSWQPPTAQELGYGLKLNGSLIINGSSSGTFVVDGRGQVSDIINDGVRKCELSAAIFSFR